MVYTQDLNVCAKNALQLGGRKENIIGLDEEGEATPTMPEPGAVEAIIGGPPW